MIPARASLAILGILLSATPAPAQSAGGLRLEDVVAATLAQSPIVLDAREAETVARGAVLAAGAPFDAQLEAFGARGQTGAMDPVTGAELLSKQLTYGVDLAKRLRQGPFIAAQMAAAQSSGAAAGLPTQSRVSVRLQVVVPLLNDRGAAVAAAPERAGRDDHRASMLAGRHAAAEAVHRAAAAYWDYLAAHRALDAQQGAEARAARLADETQVLVAADERTAADLTHMQGHLASRRLLRMHAEIALQDARLRLGLAMGLGADEIAGLAPPATDFAAPDPRREPASASRLVELARLRRADLAAADLALQAARTRADAAQRDVQPKVDLYLGAGYTGLTSGPGLTPLLSALYRNVPGMDASVQIRHELFTDKLDARGRVLSALGRQQQRRIARDDLQRRVAASVQVAADTLRRSELTVAQAGEAVRLFETMVQNEQRKFQLGVSTLFDVIQAEDALTNARLGEITSRQSHARALAALRFETGTLVAPDEDAPHVSAAVLLTPP